MAAAVVFPEESGSEHVPYPCRPSVDEEEKSPYSQCCLIMCGTAIDYVCTLFEYMYFICTVSLGTF